MPRGRHRKTKTRKVTKTAKVIALSLLAITGAQPTVASFTDSASSSVSVKAAQWVVPSITSSGYNSATITWNAIPGYSNYIVQWAKTPQFDLPVSATVSGTSFTTNDLTSATTYYWRVKPANDDANLAWSLRMSTETQQANGSLTFGDVAVYTGADKQFWNYGKTANNMSAANRTLLLSGVAAPTHMYVTDWNADGIQDIFLQTAAGSIEVKLGKPGGGFTHLTVGFSNTWNDYDVTVGRWTKNSKLPGIIAIEKATGNLYYYENPTGGQHGSRTLIGVGWNGFSIAIVDFDNDGNSDIVGRQPGTGDLLLYRSNAGGGFITEDRKKIGNGWNSMDCIGTVYDSEGPGTRGIIARELSTANLYYYGINNDGTIAAKRLFGTGFSNHKISGS